jgi:hypothetical protein
MEKPAQWTDGTTFQVGHAFRRTLLVRLSSGNS